MKKSKILAVILTLILVVTGCGSKTSKPEDAIAKATEKMKGLNNYHISMTMDMSFSEGGVSTSITMNAEQDYDTKNNTSYMFASSSMMGMDFESETYTETKDGKAYSYTSDDGETWVKNMTEETSLEPNADFELISKTQEVKIEKEENGKTTYVAKLDKEATKEFLKSMDMDDEEIEIQETTIRFTIDKDGYVSHYEITVPVAAKGQISTVKLTADFAEFNTVGDVIIPQEIIDNAEEL